MAIVQPDRGRASGGVYTRPFRSRLFSIFGASLFRILIAPAAMKLAGGAATTEIDRHCLLIARWSTLIAALVMLGWLALESGMIADAETVEQALAAIPSVIWNTSFGHILAAQTLALLGTSIALMIDRRWSWVGAAVCSKRGMTRACHAQGYAPDPVCENNLSFRNYADYAMTALASPL